jgi:hypothetical protein
VLTIVALLVAGCANTPVGGDPGARPLPPGTTCQSLQSELNRMVGKGVQGTIEAQSSGRKVSPQQAAEAERYNQMLNQYLGARCHV